MMCNLWKMKKALALYLIIYLFFASIIAVNFYRPRKVQSIDTQNEVQNNYKKCDPDRPETASSNNSRQSRQCKSISIFKQFEG